MNGISERRSAQFLQWEARGRGFRLWPAPVWPEPPFEPFGVRGHTTPEPIDDGRRPTLLSAAFQKMIGRLAPSPPGPEPDPEPDEATPRPLVRHELVELQAHIPPRLDFDAGRYARLFGSLAVCAEPIVFELLATGERVTTQFAVHPQDERLVLRQLNAFLPDVSFLSTRGTLPRAWGEPGEAETAIVDFGLGREFLLPFQPTRGDPFTGLVGALSEIDPGETALVQVIFCPATAPWHESILRSVTHADGSAMFINAPELLPGAKQKTAERLFAAVVRLATRSPVSERAWEIALQVGGALGSFASVTGNELVPLVNDGYPSDEHETDILARQTRRSGMLLTASELAGFVHVPSAEVQSARLRMEDERTKAAPATVRDTRGLRLGLNRHAGLETPVHLSREARVRHLHLIGASGTGKSSLLYNLITQGIERGEGVSVLDPHGDLIDRLLGAIPPARRRDVVLLDPSDEESVVGFNILAAHTEAENNQLASDLVAVFRRLSSAWGDQLNSVLSNALLAFMESERGGTLIDLRRFLLEPAYRNDFLSTVRDPNIVYYWRKAFPALTGNKSIGPVVTRLDTFLSPKAIRRMVGQRANRLDFGDIMDAGRIFLAKLSHGAIGKENSHLLGSLIVAKIQAAAMRRQNQRETARRDHFLCADEFHDFLTPSLAECLSGARKYRLGLVLAHQEMRQVERDADVASALLGAGTRIVFRVNDRDAKSLEAGFASFEARDIQNLGVGRAICRVERSDADFNLTVDPPHFPDDDSARFAREQVIAASRASYGTPRAEIDRLLAEAAVVESPPKPPVEPKPPASADVVTKIAPLVDHVATNPPSAPHEPAPPVPMASAPPSAENKPTPPVADLGRGGAQHQAIQNRLKDEAEKLGFHVTLEKEVLGGAGDIDLVLTRDSESIACEVTVTTTIDHEIGNVAKCLKAGFTHVVLIAGTADKAEKLRAAVLASFGATKAAGVSCFLPDPFIDYLRDLPRAQPASAARRSRAGRTVKTSRVALSPEEAKAREADAIKLMAETMRKKKRGAP
ncbi:MAG: type IV secretion system DNA-binding domain-containing protein [Verrucomicrobia bacterium]|nr:type IV secretion system DNA-binding domain-containing protein [Verrucomicrobiota bacterium]